MPILPSFFEEMPIEKQDSAGGDGLEQGPLKIKRLGCLSESPRAACEPSFYIGESGDGVKRVSEGSVFRLEARKCLNQQSNWIFE